MKQREEMLTESLRRAQQVIVARERLSEAHAAQIIVQNLELTKLTQSLEAKEKKKKTDRAVLFPGGFGRHLTGDQFVQQLREQEQRKEVEAAEKAQKMGEREARKAGKAAAEAEWKRMLAEHEAAVDAWKTDCDQLRDEGTRAKDLPTKPKRPLKPKQVEDTTRGLPGDEEGVDEEFESGRED
jgi:hypothetical protein